MENYKEKFMAEAIQMAIENIANGGGPFAALVVKDNKIIGRGVNRVTINNDPTAHAEVQAIRDACKNIESFQLEGCEIYSSCEPCPMCLGAIYWSRSLKIYYGATKKDAAAAGFDDDFIYKEIDKAGAERKIPAINVLRNKALTIFEKWKELEAKTDY